LRHGATSLGLGRERFLHVHERLDGHEAADSQGDATRQQRITRGLRRYLSSGRTTQGSGVRGGGGRAEAQCVF
jgi:hypothetical protein